MPSATDTDETIDGKNDGTITSATASMEYRLSTDISWVSVADYDNYHTPDHIGPEYDSY